MRVRSFLLFLLILIGGTFVVLNSLPPLVTHAQTADELQQQIDVHNKKIADLEVEIASYQKQLTSLGSQHQTLATSIKSLDTQRAQLTAKIKSLQQQIGALTLELQKLGGQIADKQQSISLNKRTVAQSLRDIAATDSTTVVEQIFAAGDLSDAWAAVDANVSLNEALRDHTAQLTKVKQELTDQQQAVSKTQAQLVTVTTDLGTQKKAVDITTAEKNQLLAQTKSQESAYQQLITTKRAEEASFEAALFALSSKLKYIGDPSKIPPAGKGILKWPLAQITITQQFGKTSDSGRLYASGTHDGVDFAAAIGTPVFAALTGTVEEINQGAVQNCQYGKWVLIKHDNGLTTLYAHLSQIAVTKGQSVTTGEVIGYAGMTGYATGPHLHLTVYSSQNVTFKQYTCKSGPTVMIPIAPPAAYLNPLMYL